MTSQEFCYWLQGFLEIAKPAEMNAEQVEMVKSHLNLVFTNVTGPKEEAKSDPPKILTDQKDPAQSIRDALKLDEPRTRCCGVDTRTFC